MLFRHILSAAAVSAICEVANASRCKPRTSSSEPASTTSSYSSVPSSTYAASVTSSSYIASSTSSVVASSTTSSAIISSTASESSSSPSFSSSSSSSTDSSSAVSETSSSTVSSTVSQTSSSEVSSTASVTVTESSSSTSSVETSSSTISSSTTSSSTTSSSTTSSETSSSTSSEPTPTPTQFVVNPGFEITDPLSWTYSGYQLNLAASGSLDTDAYSGSRSFIAQGNPGLWQIALKQTVSVVSGQAYLFQYALKMDPHAMCVMDILINNVRTRRPALDATSGQWATYTDLWTATSDSAAISFSSQCYNGGPTYKLYYDDITLTTVAAPQVSD
ncbi:hypothetical protein F5Y13DRAFT_187604 [Hypoxylon sp. FL1857]|nr:hypothetical protein F5Y13DRAFT_187604 [Hypoxylon sp. FL1857]